MRDSYRLHLAARLIGFTFVWPMLARLILRPDTFAQRTARRANRSALPTIWKNGARADTSAWQPVEKTCANRSANPFDLRLSAVIQFAKNAKVARESRSACANTESP